MQAQAVKEKDAVIGEDGELLRGQRPHTPVRSHVFLAPLGPTRFIHRLLTRSLRAYRTNLPLIMRYSKIFDCK